MRPPGRRTTAAVFAALTVGLGTGCPSPQTADSAYERLDPRPTPRASLAEAVQDFLAAEQARDRAGSFALLSVASREIYPSVADWTARRQEVPEVTGFALQPGERDDTVLAVVQHVPGLDPFRGLSAAREEQRFSGRRAGDGWLLDGDPATTPLLPPDAAAREAATAWVAAVQACDRTRAATLQAVTTLYGSGQRAAGLCGKPGPVSASGVGRMAPDTASDSIVTQYGAAATGWVRAVRITSPVEFSVLLAPLGPGWKVLGVAD